MEVFDSYEPPVIRLTAVNNKGIYLEAVGTVDGVEVRAPFLAMLDENGKPIMEGGVLDLLRQAKEDKDRPKPPPAEVIKDDKPEPVELIEAEPVDYSAGEAEVVEIKKRWDALLRKEMDDES